MPEDSAAWASHSAVLNPGSSGSRKIMEVREGNHSLACVFAGLTSNVLPQDRGALEFLRFRVTDHPPCLFLGLEWTRTWNFHFRTRMSQSLLLAQQSLVLPDWFSGSWVPS